MGNQASGGLLSPYLASRRLAVARPWLRGSVLDYGCGGGSVAALCEPSSYLGVDCDEDALTVARYRYPQHVFVRELPSGRAFDTVCMLAVIEHLPEPNKVLTELCEKLIPGGRLILTTPAPWVRRVHEWGASVGLFSSEAAEEHKALLGRSRLIGLIGSIGCRVVCYRRFLLGANQVVVAER